MAAIKFVQDLEEDVFSEPKQSATLAYASMVLATTPIDSLNSCVITMSHVTLSLPKTPPNISIPIPAPAEF